jgi:hypothetical protein
VVSGVSRCCLGLANEGPPRSTSLGQAITAALLNFPFREWTKVVEVNRDAGAAPSSTPSSPLGLRGQRMMIPSIAIVPLCCTMTIV